MLRSILALALGFSSAAQASDEPLIEWIQARSAGYHSPESARRLVADTRACAQKYKVSEELVWKVMATESSLIPTARSKAGAKGLMQVIPKWHPEKISHRTVFSQRVNICAGAWILREYQDRYGGLTRALHAYNGLNGHPTAYAKKVRSVKLPRLAMAAETPVTSGTAPPALTPAPTQAGDRPDWAALLEFLDAPRKAINHSNRPEKVNVSLNIRS